MQTYQYIIIFGILLIIAFALVKSNKKDLKFNIINIL